MGITSMHRVCTRSKCYTFLSSIRCCSCIFTIGNIGCNGQNRCCLDTATVSMVSFYISDKGVEHLFCDLVNTIVVISIFREITLNLKVNGHTILITDWFDFCIFDRRKGVCYYRKSCNTGCKPSSHIFVM